MANLSPFGPQLQYEDSAGEPAVGYRLFFYVNNSVGTKQDTYTTAAGTVANTNPIVLNALGQPANGIFFPAGQAYTIQYAPPGSDDPPNSPIWTRNDVYGVNDVTATQDQWVASGVVPTYVSGTSFTLPGDQTSNFQIGRRVKTTNSGGTVYSTIIGSAYAALTTVTVVNDSGSLDSGLSAVSYALLSATNNSIPVVALDVINVQKACPPGQGVLLNGLVVTSVGSNALTIAIKGADGNDPSASNPVFVAFRSATLGTAGFTVRKITAALSMTVSSGSTLGHASGSACHLFAYLIDNSGTVEVAVSNLPPDYPGTFANTRLISTTAEGGAGAADSATGIYSTTGRSNVPWVCVAMCKSTQTTAGTWAANMTQVDQAPFKIPANIFIVTKSGGQNVATATWTKVTFDVEALDADGVFDTTNSRYTPNIAGVISLEQILPFDTFVSGQRLIIDVYKNGASGACYSMNNPATAGQTGAVNPVTRLLANGTTDYFEFYVYQDTGGTIATSVGAVRFSGARISGGQ